MRRRTKVGMRRLYARRGHPRDQASRAPWTRPARFAIASPFRAAAVLRRRLCAEDAEGGSM